MKKYLDKLIECIPHALNIFFRALPVLTIYQSLLLIIAPTTTNRVMTAVLLALMFFKLWMKKR